jgi:hypothetical protein
MTRLTDTAYTAALIGIITVFLLLADGLLALH